MECSIGKFLNLECHRTIYCRHSEIIHSSGLTSEDKDLIYYRTGLLQEALESICTHHYKTYVEKYFHVNGKKCADPLSKHKGTLYLMNLREITNEMRSKYLAIVTLTPGQAICCNCLSAVSSICYDEISELHPESPVVLSEMENLSFQADENLEKINTVCELLDESPVKIRKLSMDRRKQKIEEKLANVTRKLKRGLESSCSVQRLEGVGASSSNDLHYEYLNLIEELKTRFKETDSASKKCEILTLLPTTWSIAKIQAEFQCSEHLARRARHLRSEYGVLPEIEKANRNDDKKISHEVIQQVVTFYENDDVSRIMPGKKDCLTVREKDKPKTKAQKRLLLLNLKEIYLYFKETYPEIKIGMSKFSELRPSWCVSAGSSGTHSVCVCSIHQNVKLSLEAAGISKQSYKEILDNMVCSTNNEGCMLSTCTKCPGIDQLDFQICGSDDIRYKQWVSTDRCELVTLIKPKDEFLLELKGKLLNLKSHDFIAKKQSAFLNSSKESLRSNEVLVLGDFSENFTFVVQDEVQSFHWAKSQATLHPFVVYFTEMGELKSKSICFISDELTHNTVAVYAFQKALIRFIKEKIVEIVKISYFSDGSAAQYKNKKNFINLCYHNEDFGVQAEWHFFATSHGKSPCDGIGGTIKRIVTRTSLQRTSDRQILTPMDMFTFCQENIKGITFFFIPKEEIESCFQFLTNRFLNMKRLPETRKYHSFVPVDKKSLRVSTFSGSQNSKICSVQK